MQGRCFVVGRIILLSLLSAGCAYGHPLVGVLPGEAGSAALPVELSAVLFAGGGAGIAAPADDESGDGSSTTTSTTPLPVTSGLSAHMIAGSLNLTDGTPASTLQNEALAGLGLSSASWPLYRSTAFNGRAGLQFTGSENIVVDTSGLVYNGVTVILAVYSDSAGDGTGMVEHRNAADVGSWSILQCTPPWGCGTGGLRIEMLGSPAYDTPVLSDQFRILTFRNVPNTSIDVYCDGGLLNLYGGTYTVANNGNNLRIGSRYTGASFFVGYIAEIAFYARNLSESERQEVESYLSAKYGIALGGGC